MCFVAEGLNNSFVLFINAALTILRSSRIFREDSIIVQMYFYTHTEVIVYFFVTLKIYLFCIIPKDKLAVKCIPRKFNKTRLNYSNRKKSPLYLDNYIKTIE